jgi:hypothetical protein
LRLQRIQLRLLSKLTGESVPECEPDAAEPEPLASGAAR